MRRKRLGRAVLASLTTLLFGGFSAGAASVTDPFPTARPVHRLQAVGWIGGGAHAAETCLTVRASSIALHPRESAAAARRALAYLAAEAPLAEERRATDARGTVYRFTFDRGSLDRLDPRSRLADGTPTAVAAAMDGIEAARDLFGRLDLPEPSGLDVVLARLGPSASGIYVASERGGGAGTIWLDGAGDGDPDAIRVEAAHQYAHAVASRLSLDPSWAEALAAWASISIPGSGSPRATVSISRRLARLGEGIPTEDVELSAGNAAWISWLAESKGPTALRLALEELGKRQPFDQAMERALRRADGSNLAEGLRDFHLWTVLVGSRDDGRHFPFARRLADPVFFGSFEALPAISIRDGAGIGPLGAAQAMLRPLERSGGITVRFEGEFGGVWECDLLLRREDGGLHRLAVPLDGDGRGGTTVPASSAIEILVLVRNLENDDAAPRRFTWTAFSEPGYPLEFGAVSATLADFPEGAVTVRWDTISETGIHGFHVVRSRSGETSFRRIHDVWVPAVGDPVEGALYEMVDLEAEPGVAYEYRIVAIAEHGLTSTSSSATVRVPSRPRP